MKSPLEKLVVTQPFGSRPEYYAQFGMKGHNGIDFRTVNLGTNQGWFSNFMGWQNVYAVKDGSCVVTYDKGGYGTHIVLTDIDGNQYLYGHLKNARPPVSSYAAYNQLFFNTKEGDVIGITGKSGNANGSHLHFGYRPKPADAYNGFFGYVDPLPLFQAPQLPKVPLQIARIGTQLAPGEEFKAKVLEYSSGKITLNLADYSYPTPHSITQDEAYALVDMVKPKEKFVFIHYTPIPGQAYYYATTYLYPEKNCMITTCPTPDPRTLAFEFAHQLGVLVNHTLGFKFEIFDAPGANGPTDAEIKKKYDLATPYYE